jgi:tRNA/tmRNA/rRNA uracil-C5-methylase (TrmA/RlmC/RlmD family)
MDAVFHPNGLGFRRKGTWDRVMDIEQCAISNERINELFKELREFFKSVDAFDLRKHTGTFRYAVIRAPAAASISFVLNSGSPRVAEAIERIKQFAETTTAENIAVAYVAPQTDVSLSDEFFMVKGSDMLKESYLGKDFLFSIQGFFQNNTEMAEKMHEYVRGLLGKHETKGATLLDLYGGVGTFGINNADLFKKTVIVESVQGCIDAANMNIANNRVSNAEAIVMDARYLKKLDLGRPLLVVNDPPRQGMHPKAIEQLNLLKPDVILYISCNVDQLSKDIPKFKGFKVKSAAIFDLFPQTPHVETIAELVPA